MRSRAVVTSPAAGLPRPRRAGAGRRPSARLAWFWLLLALAPVRVAAQAVPGEAAKAAVVGSKRFTESYILGEVVRQTLAGAGVAAEHRKGLGNTGILEQALASGAVDVYPEYTGTIVRELLRRGAPPGAAGGAAPTLDEINAALAPRGLKAAVLLGFDNSYALAMRADLADRLGVRSISDLARLAPGAVRPGFSHEFQQRADGWPALQRAYALPMAAGAALDHGLAYAALRAGQVDLVDVYTTDARVGRERLRVLADDRAFFPRYDAVLLMRAGFDERPLQRLAGRIDAAAMVAMNAEVELDGRRDHEVARRFVGRLGAGPRAAGALEPAARAASAAAGQPAPARPRFVDRLFAPDLGRLLSEHVVLVFGSLVLALAAGVPLGICAWARPRAAGWLLGAVGVLQTVPSLALLAALIALMGRIGLAPALAALFLYALLPIVRNTHAGLHGVPHGLALAARALGMTPRQVLRHVQLPLALPTLLAGVKTAAVINVGTATVAAFVGAGGLGERIVAGLAVNDAQAMLAGALPAALLALALQGGFEAAERRWLRRRG